MEEIEALLTCPRMLFLSHSHTHVCVYQVFSSQKYNTHGLLSTVMLCRYGLFELKSVCVVSVCPRRVTVKSNGAYTMDPMILSWKLCKDCCKSGLPGLIPLRMLQMYCRVHPQYFAIIASLKPI